MLFLNNTWYPAVPDYVERAFNYAAATGTTAKLFYNDYGGFIFFILLFPRVESVFDMVPQTNGTRP